MSVLDTRRATQLKLSRKLPDVLSSCSRRHVKYKEHAPCTFLAVATENLPLMLHRLDRSALQLILNCRQLVNWTGKGRTTSQFHFLQVWFSPVERTIKPGAADHRQNAHRSTLRLPCIDDGTTSR